MHEIGTLICLITFKGEELLITDLYTNMERLLKRVLGFFVKVEEIRQASDVVNVDFSTVNQLSDLELFIGNDARTYLTAAEEDVSAEQIANFYR